MKNLLPVITILIILITARSYGMSGCSTTAALCPAVTTLSTVTSNWLVANCGCPAATEYSTVFKIVNVAKFCPATPPVGGPIANFLCPDVITALGSLTALTGCTNVMGPTCLGAGTAALIAACELLPVNPDDLKRVF